MGSKNKFYYAAIWSLTEGDGISKKITSQIRAFEKLDETHSTVIEARKPHKQLLALWKVFITQAFNNTEGFTISYFRNVNGWSFLLLYALAFFTKSQHKILEIPTWPFSGENSNRLSNFRLNIQSFMASKIFTRIVFMGEETRRIWGLNATKLDNCVSDETIWQYELKSERHMNEYHLICVASHAPWHGYERLLAQSDQFKRFNIYVHVVGHSENLENLKDRYYPEFRDNLFFHGILNGESLHRLYLDMDCGIDSLGRHRSGNQANSSLKSKEYLAFGLPVILSHLDHSLEGKDFVLRIPSDETAVDLKCVVSLIDRFRDKKVEIRNYSFSQFRWEIAFKRLIDDISQ